jgi:glycerol kinase
VAWNRTTGEPIGPVLGWQDARTAPWCAELVATPGLAALVRERTGLALDSMFSAPKITWLPAFVPAFLRARLPVLGP